MASKILIVDDDMEIRSELRDLLEGYDVLEASGGREALELLKKAHEIGLVILDVMMPRMSGLDVLTEIKKSDPDIAIIILTGHSSEDVAIDALKGRADDYIEKPVNISNLKTAVDKFLENRPGGDANILDLNGKIEKVKKFIERNCYKKTTLREAADAVCLSPKYLSRAFKESVGSGFTDYKLKIKINKAKELFKTSGYSVDQVSEKLGYENTESFIRQFKKICRQTPAKFRRQIRSPHKIKSKIKKRKK